MNKKYLILMLSFLVFISSCSKYTNDKSKNLDRYTCYDTMIEYARENSPTNINVEELFKVYCGSEKYNNVKILTDEHGYKNKIELIDNGNIYKRAYIPDSRDAMEWLKKNTPKDAKIGAWWDYGAMIKVFAEREPIALSPSKEALQFTASYTFNKSVSDFPKLEDSLKIKKIALVLTTENPSEAIKLVKELDATYLFIPLGSELGKFPVIYELAYGDGKLKFIKTEELSMVEESEADTKSIMYKALTGQTIPGFKKVYSDDNNVILEVI